jgi:queuosine precursor transporter
MPQSNVGDRSYRYYDLIGMLFVATLLISNTVGVKVLQIGPLSLPGGVLVFPISYIFGDVLTEVYGYRASRRIIWFGLLMNFLMSGVYAVVGAITPASFWTGQQSYDAILGQVPRIVSASMVAYFCGEFSNSYVLAKLKIVTRGKYLWTRTIASTLVGEGIDTVVFVLLAFTGVFEPGDLLVIAVSNYVFKVAYEIASTPMTYAIVGFLKRAEAEDYYDHDTNFNPFALHDSGVRSRPGR